MDRILEKTCSCCHVSKPATLEYFKLGNKLKDGTRGLCSWCRDCTRKSNKRWKESEKGQQYNVKVREKYRAAHPPQTKTCNECHATYPFGSGQFSSGKPYCRACGERRREEARERQRQRRKAELAAPTRTCTICKQAKPNTPQFFYMNQSGNMCHTCRLEAGRVWARNNPAAIIAKRNARRAKKKAAGGIHTPRHIERQFQQQQGKCYWCRATLQTSGQDKYHVDHLIALNQGGSNGPENIVCACPTCNIAKSDKLPWDFAGRLL